MSSFNDFMKMGKDDIQKKGARITVSSDGTGLSIDGECNGMFVLMAISALADDMRRQMRDIGMTEGEIDSILHEVAMFDAEKFDIEMEERLQGMS